ncbi:hypothetical protein JR064_22320 [Xanthomonas sp. CFBP 8703]|uniref:Uncharacterized protein n=1 Tax=Xanthomonas bonasiae TaxID=2810351 RepID=A0ABS3BD73_9XANT|nr:hypothetical protein [Xanthomonas bonasiae]MBN6104904.1 hypothetical protein [Xanthomonas bonasiae]
MSGIRKLERDFAQADIAAVTSLLSQLTDEDVMARFGLESRLEELRASLSRLDTIAEVEGASAALFFGGRPVVGTRGIETEFGGTAVAKFQDIISKVMAHEAGRLGQRGVVPNKGASSLHITNVVRGSFGFLLEEIHDQPDMLDAPLKQAVQETSRMLSAFSEPDEEEFRTAVESIDQRVLNTAREFFDLMKSNGTTLRLVAGNRDNSFGQEAVSRAAERAQSTSVEETEEWIDGQLSGTLPDAHQFEFRRQVDGVVIRGKVARSFTAEELLGFNRQWVDQGAVAKVKVNKVRRNGEVVREQYTLLELKLSLA